MHAVVDDATVVGGFGHGVRRLYLRIKAMAELTLATRVENLEKRVELLEQLPARMSAVELQIVQLRTEMREQFSAIRADIEGFRGESQSGLDAARNELRAEIKAACDEVRIDLRAEIRAAGEAVRTELRVEIRAGDEETRRYMRVLHEEVLSRLALIEEGRPRRRKR